MIKERIMGNTNRIQQKNILWNMIASTLAAGQSALMLIIVNRTVGLNEAGIFTLAYSIAQMMMTIGYFDMRSYQVTDVKDEMPFKHYFSSRIITCLLMMAVSVFYIVFKHYTGYKAGVIFFTCLFKMVDALEDVIHALFQKRGRLDIAGKLQTIRFSLVIVVFAVTLLLTKNSMVSIIICTIVSAVIVLFFNIPLITEFAQLKLDFSPEPLKVLFKACLPLFIGSYLALYMENSPKYAIDIYLSEADQAQYGMLAMTAFVVNLFSGFAFRPMLTPLAMSWRDKNYRRYRKIIMRLLSWVVILTVGIAVGAYIIGIPVLSFVYGTDLSKLRMILVIIVAAGGINSFGTILYYSLTVMRRQNWLLAGYIVTAAVAFFLSPYCVKNYGLTGAACAFALIVTVRSLVFIGIFFAGYRRREKE